MGLDEFLHPFDALFVGVADLDASLRDESLGAAMHIDRAVLDLPIELDVTVDDDGRVSLLGAPPTQQVQTTWMPVFHQIRLTVEPAP